VPSNRFEQEIAMQIASAGEQFRMGQISAIAAPKVTVVTTGGASLSVPRLATWTPVVGDIVLLAMTPAGLIAIGKVF
jgi:hypothetical protein